MMQKVIKKKNILVFYYSAGHGGVKIFLKNLLPGLMDKFNITIASVESEELAAELADEGKPLPSYRIPVKKIFKFWGIFQFIRVLRKEKIDIIFSNDLILSVYARIFKLLFPKLRQITVVHGNFRCFKYRTPLVVPLLSFLNRFTQKLVDKYICVSNYIAGCLIKEGVLKNNIEVIYNGIARPDHGKDLDSGGPTHVAFVGRLSHEKGVDYFLEIAQQFINKKSPVEFHIFAGPKEEKYFKLVQQLCNQYPNLIFYHGLVKDVFEKYPIDVVVMPSRDEGLPFVALEAFAYGKPLVASRVGGLKEIIQDGENGLLCEPGVTKSFCQAVERLIFDTELREKLVKNARDLIKTRFDFVAMQQEYANLLEKV